MVEIKIEDPDLVERKRVDSEGRVYVGREYADADVRLALVRIDDEGDSGNPNSPPLTATSD